MVFISYTKAQTRYAFFKWIRDTGYMNRPMVDGETDFVGPAEVFSTLLAAPYEQDVKWTLYATKLGGEG